MSVITFLMSGLIFVALYLGVNYLHLYFRLRWDRKHLYFSLMCFAAMVYIACTLFEYMSVTVDKYFIYLRIQVLAVPLFFVPLVWLSSLYTGKKVTPVNWFISIGISFFMIIRVFHPYALTVSQPRGMKPWLLPWNEVIWLVDADVNIFSYVYYLFLIIIYATVCYYLIYQYRQGERRKALYLLAAVVVFLGANVNDILVVIFQVRWLFLSEFGFTGFLVIMSSQLYGEVVRLADVEKQLEETDLQRRAIFNSMFQFTGLLDVEGRLIDANRVALEFANIALDDVKGEYFWNTPWWDGLEDEKEKLRNAIARAGAGEFVRYETANTDGKGEVMMIDISLNPVSDASGKVKYIVPEGRDISRIREAEKTILQNNLELTALNEDLNATIEELEATNEEFEAQNEELLKSQGEVMERTREYRNLFELAGDAILVIRDGHIIDCNERAAEYFGYEKKSLMGRHTLSLSAEMQPDGSDSGTEEEKRITKALKGSLQQYEWSYRRNDGSLLSAEVTLKSIEFSRGVGLQAIIRDISDRKEAENERQRMRIQLAHAQKMEAVGTLAGGLAHDFNNILSGIMGSLNMLQIILGKETLKRGDDVTRYLDMGMDASRRSADIVSQLLSFSRKEEQEQKSLDLNESLEHVEKICINSFPKSVNINFRTCSKKMIIKGDPVRIEQLILNLAVNASHAMTIMRDEKEKQGGTLSVYCETVNRRDLPALAGPGFSFEREYVALHVKDTGVGMSPEEQEKIFEPFYTTKKKDVGTGLGLAMSFNIVRQHDGFMHVESEIGKGTDFSVFLPLYTRGTAEKEQTDGSSVLVEGRGALLVVDDEQYLLELAQGILEECGYQVTTVNRPEEAVAYFQQHHASLDGVLLDLSMPGMSGVEVFSALKEIDPEVLCILASGKFEEGLREKACSLGIADFIEKPYQAVSLSEKVKDLLNRSSNSKK